MANYFTFESYHLINKVFISLIDLLGILLISWVYLVNPKKKINRLFCFFAGSILFWASAGYFLNFSRTFNRALFWAKFAPSAVFIFLIAFYFFAINFPRERRTPSRINKIIGLLGCVLALLTFFSNFIVADIQFTEWGVNPIFTQFGRIGFYSTVILFTFFAIAQILKRYFTLLKEEKLRVQYFLMGLFIFVIMNLIFNVALPLWRDSIQYWQFGNYSAIFLLGFTAYAIVKRELFGIKVVLTTLLVGLIATLLFLDALLLTENWTIRLIKGIILVIFLYFGYLLIKSVFGEIKRREEVEKLSRAKSEFISIASHQLRTPLTAIQGYVSMILEGTYGSLSEKIQKPMENVHSSSERLIKLVDDLLNVSRIETGKIEVKFETASLENLIASVVEELKGTAKKKGIYLKWEKPEETLPKISIDKDKIRQVVLNVIDNAIRYTNEGGVTVNLKQENSNLRITVKDTGEGLTRYELSKMFESFSRGAAGTRLYTEGVGLGLYIARRFVEMHNGKIWAESRGRRKGSTFYIELPIK